MRRTYIRFSFSSFLAQLASFEFVSLIFITDGQKILSATPFSFLCTYVLVRISIILFSE